MNYNWSDTNYYLKFYKQIKTELSLFLSSNFSKKEEDVLVKSNILTNSNEKITIIKLTDKQYEKDNYALKCVDDLYNDMGSKESKIMTCRYINNMTTKAISIKVNYSESTVKRVINTQRKKLLKKLNKIELFEPK